MGTRGHCHFRFASSDLAAIGEQLAALRPLVQARQHEAAIMFMAQHAEHMIDNAAARGLVADRPLAAAFGQLRERQDALRRSGRRDIPVDFHFSLAILPFEGCVYGILSSGQAAWRDLFYAQDGIEDYPRDDDADCRNGGMAADAAERRRIWDLVLAQNASFPNVATGSFRVEFVPPSEHVTPEEVLRHISPFEQRLRRQASLMLTDERFRAIKSAHPELARRDRVGAAMEAMRWAETEQGTADLALIMETIRPRLPERITREILLGS